jgi:uncharacterized FlaG/YvyC family protein
MDIGAVKRAPATVSQVTTVREPAQSIVQPVATELPSYESVQSIGAASAVPGDTVAFSDEARAQAVRLQALEKTIKTQLDIDPTTREVVIRTVNQQTGRVVVQVPDEVSLKMRQFAALMREKDDAVQAVRIKYSSVA